MDSKSEKIYLDQEGYEKYLENIESVKKQLNDLNAGRKEAFDAGAGDGWDTPEFEEIERQEAVLMGNLKKLYEDLSKIVIIERHNNQELIDINDTVIVDLIFSKDDVEEMTIKLVSALGLSDGNFAREVSINSPLGKAIFGKSVGDNSSYKVNDNVIKVLIKQKLELEQGLSR